MNTPRSRTSHKGTRHNPRVLVDQIQDALLVGAILVLARGRVVKGSTKAELNFISKHLFLAPALPKNFSGMTHPPTGPAQAMPEGVRWVSVLISQTPGRADQKTSARFHPICKNLN